MLIFIDMIRTILFAAILLSTTAVKAQTFFGAMNSVPSQQVSDTNHAPKKWFITKYAGISTGFVAFKGGGGSFLSVPLTLQLNRQLTNNLYAFGAVSAAPSIFRFNAMSYQPAVNKNNSFMRTNNNFSAYADAKIGMMYISNDKTFSISGSIGVSRNSYSPFYNPFYSPVPVTNQ